MADAASDAFKFLRESAINAHLAGDGTQALHFCFVALNAIDKRAGLGGSDRYQLSDVRWSFSLALYWAYYDRHLEDIKNRFENVRVSRLGRTDLQVLKCVHSMLSDPLSSIDLESLGAVPATWLKSRLREPDDLALLSLILEWCWVRNPTGCDWKDLANDWKQTLPLRRRDEFRRLDRLYERLEAQSRLIAHPRILHGIDSELLCKRHHDYPMAYGWKLLFERDKEGLKRFIMEQTAGATNEDAFLPLSAVITLYRALAKEESLGSEFYSRYEFLQASGRRKAFDLLCDATFRQGALLIARDPPERVDQTVRACVRLALRGKIAALREWNVLDWMRWEANYGDLCFELAEIESPGFVKTAIRSWVMGLRFLYVVPTQPGIEDSLSLLPSGDALTSGVGAPKRRGLPSGYRFYQAVATLDRCDVDQRRHVALGLLNTWPLHEVVASNALTALSDSIPQDLLLDVAHWSVKFEESQGTENYTTLAFWNDVLPYTDLAAEIVTILGRVLIRVCTNDRLWDQGFWAISNALAYGSQRTSRRLFAALTGVSSQDSALGAVRWCIIYDACVRNREALKDFGEWLRANSSGNPMWCHLLFRLENSVVPQTSINDPNLRKSLRQAVSSFIDVITTRNGQVIGNSEIRLYGYWYRYTTWPRSEPQVMKQLTDAIESPDVLLAQKGILFSVLAEIVRLGPQRQAHRLVSFALRWQHEQLPGQIFSPSDAASPSPFDARGADREHAQRGLLHFQVRMLDRCARKMHGPTAQWICESEFRQPSIYADALLMLIVRLAIAPDSDHFVVSRLLGLVEDCRRLIRLGNLRDFIVAFHALIQPGNPNSYLLADWVQDERRRLILQSWRHQIPAFAKSPSYLVRQDTAELLQTWKQNSEKWPSFHFSDALNECLERLANDPRGRVRQAALRGV
jgi:hypothetical protein